MSDVFVALWKNARQLCRTGAPVKAWLVVTARNAGINRLRQLRRRQALPLDEDVADAMQLLDAVPSDAEELVGALVACFTGGTFANFPALAESMPILKETFLVGPVNGIVVSLILYVILAAILPKKEA